jgi:hypothetical protein
MKKGVELRTELRIEQLRAKEALLSEWESTSDEV